MKWIEDLRSDVADLIATMIILSSTIATKGKNIDADKLDRLVHTSHRVLLRLNHNESEHQKLTKLLDSLADRCTDQMRARKAGEQFDDTEIRELLDVVASVSTCTRAILKTESERVKKVE